MPSNKMDAERAANLCREYLHGAWKQVNADNIGFKQLGGGLSNFLYHVSLPIDLQKELAQAQVPSASSSSLPSPNPHSLHESTNDDFEYKLFSNDSNDVELPSTSNGTYRSRSRSRSSSWPSETSNLCAVLNGNTESTPTEVLIRIYGQVHGEQDLLTESVIFTLLSERKIGPKLYGVFNGGRIEQYIKARPLTTDELATPVLSMQVARRIAQLHNMDLPISKEPVWFMHTMRKWLKKTEQCLNDREQFSKFSEQILKIRAFDLAKEMQWLQTFLKSVESPVVFCHNDLQENNILMVLDEKDEENNLVLIDFEYCSYNYRGFDIANHFIEWTYNYVSNNNYPFYSEDVFKYPTREQQLRFINEYLSISDNICHPEEILNEIEAFTLASHFFWGIWSCANAPLKQITFGYWDYGLCRLERYFEAKERLLNRRHSAAD